MEEKAGRRARKKTASRRAILDAAATLFSEQGFRETSIAEIMGRANLGVGTFYNYFRSKEDILSAILQDMGQNLSETMRKLREDDKSSLEILAQCAAVTARFLDENRFVLPLFLAASERSAFPEDKEHSRTKLECPPMKPLFEQIIRDGQRKGEIRRDVPPPIITEMLHSIYQAAAFSKLTMPFRDNIAIKIALLSDGIRARR